MKKVFLLALLMISMMISNYSFAKTTNDSTQNKKLKPGVMSAGLKLPAGFTATVFASGLGEARHIAVTSKGDVYVKLSSLKAW